VTPLQSLSIVLLIAALSAWLNHRFVRLPSAIGVMSISLIFSLNAICLDRWGVLDITHAVSFVRGYDFESVLLHGMLAFLLFAGALTVNWQDLSSQRGPVAALATVGVVISTALTGWLFWCSLGWVGMEIPLISALLFGAIVSPTDPVAVLGILRKMGAAKSLETKIVGESLFNDGVAVVIFLAVSSVAAGRAVSPEMLLGRVAAEIIGGAALGYVLGWATYRMIKPVDAYVVEILLTLALAGGCYGLAEAVHVSAPICVVVAGLIIGNQGRALAMSERTREHLDVFWELVDELLNAVLFVLIGLEVLELSVNYHFVLAGIFAIAALFFGRLVSVWVPLAFMRGRADFSPHSLKILCWGGLRGGISVALALSVPEGGAHDLIVVATYIVVLFSVLVQGTTLPHLLKYVRVNT
jgi:CPA1 family monovalent cation:H+ antiporter